MLAVENRPHRNPRGRSIGFKGGFREIVGRKSRAVALVWAFAFRANLTSGLSSSNRSGHQEQKCWKEGRVKAKLLPSISFNIGGSGPGVAVATRATKTPATASTVGA